jgi:hypothetical protein
MHCRTGSTASPGIGDLHVRDESWLYSRSNATDLHRLRRAQSQRPVRYQSITSGTLPPILNSTQNRPNMLRLQAHIGMNVKLGDTITAGVALASGDDNNPVSTTQTLGGGLVKKDIWLNQAWIRWQPSKDLFAHGRPHARSVSGHRPDLCPELNFDGVAAHGDLPITDDLSSFATLGAFPIQYVDNEAPTNSYSSDKICPATSG